MGTVRQWAWRTYARRARTPAERNDERSTKSGCLVVAVLPLKRKRLGLIVPQLSAVGLSPLVVIAPKRHYIVLPPVTVVTQPAQYVLGCTQMKRTYPA
jgi:hypothetical protein